MRNGIAPEGSAIALFAELLRHHMHAGTRPAGKHGTGAWSLDAFVYAVGVSRRAVSYYRSGSILPSDISHIIDAFFGEDPRHTQARSAFLAAFDTARGIAPSPVVFTPIESGPSSKPQEGPQIDPDDQREQIRAAERRWSYLQRSRLLGLEVLFVLKSPVGQDWFRRVLDDTRVRFSTDGASFTVGTIFALSAEPNTKERSPHWTDPACAFWEKYEPDPSFWVRRIAPEPKKFPLVAGFDASIPWASIDLPSVTTLEELGRLSDFGIGIPPEAFMAGIEEFELTFVGEQFSFSLPLSDHGLEFLHEMASAHFGVSRTGKPAPLSLGSSFSGFQLLEMFQKQMMPDAGRMKSKERSGIVGIAGPGDKAISFYPTMPLDFMKSPESSKYSFKVTVPAGTKARITELEARLASASADTEIYRELAARYSSEGRHHDAIRCLERGVQHVPPDADLYALLGQSLGELGRHEEAIVNLKKAEAIGPNKAAIHCGLGISLSQIGDDDAALHQFETAVRLEPSHAGHHKNLGRCLARQERYTDAMASYERAVTLAPDDVDSLMLLGVFYDNIGNSQDARLRFEAATRVAPTDPETYENLGRHLALVGDHAEAIPILERAIEIKESARRHELLGGSYAELSRWSEAEASFRKAVVIAPDTSQFLVNLGVCVSTQGRYDEAIKIFERVLAISPGNSEASNILAQLRDAARPNP